MSTAADLIERVRARTRDNGPNPLVGDDDILIFLNDAKDDLALRMELTEHTKTGTTSGNTINLPPAVSDPELTELFSFDLGTDNHVRIVSVDEFNANVEGGTSPLDSIGFIFDGVLTLYPTPTTGTAYTMRYHALPAQMIATDDVWPLPRWTERKAISYAAYQACLLDERLGVADRYLGEYEQDLPSVPLGRAKKFPGPLRITIAGTVFDRDTRARHLGRLA